MGIKSFRIDQQLCQCLYQIDCLRHGLIVKPSSNHNYCDYQSHFKSIKIIPFVMESTSAFGKISNEFLLKLASYNSDLFDDNGVSKSEVVMHMRRLLSIALQIGNSLVFDEGLNSLYKNYYCLNSVYNSNSDKFYFSNNNNYEDSVCD